MNPLSTRSRARRGVVSLALIASALLALVFAASAHAITYVQGTPLPVGKLISSVAVDQATGDVYVSAAGVNTPTFGEGVLKRFNSAGVEQPCTLAPNVEHPAGLAVNPTNGNLAVVDLSVTATGGELRTFPAGCGSELGVTSGTADTEKDSAALTNVSTDHPLREGQVIEGAGIPKATATATVTASSETLTGLGSISGTFAIGERVTGDGIPAGATIAACVPECSAPTELTLSAPASPSGGGTGLKIVARTTVLSASGSTATLSSNATATASGAAIKGTSWRVEAGGNNFPTGQPAINATGQVYWPNRQGNKLQKYTSWGEELVEGGFPNTTNTKRAAAVALDAKEDVFVTNSGTVTAGVSCIAPSAFNLKKLKPDGSEFANGEAGVTGPESVFAGLSSNTTTVAVDKSTGNVYAGRGCQGQPGAEFTIEVYGPGGTKLAEGIGAGLFDIGGAAPNHLAVNEAAGTLYAIDIGTTETSHKKVQVFEDTSPQKTLDSSASGSVPGTVQCNMTGKACLAGYDEGQEVIVEAVGGTEFKEWNGGTGSAASCNGVTATSCTFFLNENSSINAKYATSYPLSLSTSGSGSGTFTCKTLPGGSEEPCAATYEEGAEVEVLAHPGTGSHFVEFNAENGGECSGATCVVTLSAARTVNAKNDLDLESFTPSSTGPGSLECKDETAAGSFGPCAATYPYGHTVKVKAVPNTGAHQTSLSGSGSATGSCSGSECSFAITEASGASAEFALDEESLSVLTPGSGTGEVKCNGGSCAGPWHYGDMIEVTATPTGGSALGTVSGTGSASSCSGSPCSFQIKEASSLTVPFLPPGAAELSVAKGGNGTGTVQSAPSGIDCGATCTAIYTEGDTVTLTQSATEPGSVFVAWSSNCTPISLTQCEVEVQPGGTVVTATFVAVPVISSVPGAPAGPCGEAGGTKIEYAGTTQYVCNGSTPTVTVTPFSGDQHGCAEGGLDVEVNATHSYVCNGLKGANGAPGENPTVTPFTGNQHGCAEGGLDVAVGASHAYVCNGVKGTNGSPGASPTITPFSGNLHGCTEGGLDIAVESTHSYVCNGKAGTNGSNGSPGPQGPKGDTGSAGAQGAQGATGPQGAQGPAGKVKVTCKVKGSKKVTCKVKSSSASASRLRWALRRSGRLVRTGNGSPAALQRVLNHLPPGHYALHIAGQGGTVAIDRAG